MNKPNITPAFDLVRDAAAKRLSPSALMRRTYDAYREAKADMPRKPSAAEAAAFARIDEAQRIYKREYQVFLKAQRARLAAQRSAKGQRKDAGIPELSAAEVRGVQQLNAGLAQVAKQAWAEHPNNPQRASAQRQERADLPQADAERFAVEQPAPRPLLDNAAVLRHALQVVTLLKTLPPQVVELIMPELREIGGGK